MLRLQVGLEYRIKDRVAQTAAVLVLEHQPEGYGEETALDLHDGAFKSEIAFDTFTSYNPVTGEHNCSRKPKRVVVRLISADGSQWDRKELKITEAFRYDEEKGYVLHSDLILHGWCPGGR